MKLVKEFYDFVYERESIRIRRHSGLPPPWTHDEILQTYRFTNVKREHDRTTRELVARFYPRDVENHGILLLNCGIARFFGLAETVQAIGYRPGWDEFEREYVRSVVRSRQERRERVFTSAYIVPNCGDTDPKHEVVLRILDDLWAFAEDDLLDADPSWQRLIEAMCEKIRGMGSFMAKEVVLDFILVSGWVPSDWDTWTPIGPGARRGAARCYYGGTIDRLPSEKLALEWTRQLYEARAEHWRRPVVISPEGAAQSYITLELSDIQFQLCEFDKYMREKLGEGHPKAKFKPKTDTP